MGADEVFKAINVKELTAGSTTLLEATTITDAGTGVTGLTITTSETTSKGLVITAGGTGLNINHSDTNTYALDCVGTGILAASVEALARFDMRNASATKKVIQVDNDGVGAGIFIDQNCPTAGAAALEIDKDVTTSAATEYGIKVVCDVAAGGGAAAGVDLSSFAAGEICINFPDGNASTIEPQTTDESGWINIGIGGTVKYIPYYDAS